MLAMEACKISDGGQLNSGTTAEPFFYYGGYNERRRREFLGGPGGMLPLEILKSETSRSPGNAIKFTSCC
jgi:hypothetical protein